MGFVSLNNYPGSQTVAKLIQMAGLTAITGSLVFRSDIHPKDQLKALQALRDQMHEHIDDDAMVLLKTTITELETGLKEAGMT